MLEDIVYPSDFPPHGSLAAEILNPSFSATPHFQRAKSLLTDLKEMTSRFSDFESCVSSSDDEVPENETDDGFKSMNDKKRGWKKKRKSSESPLGKEAFLKKTNRNLSPKLNPVQ